MLYVDYVYDVVAEQCAGMDSVYEDFITHLVGNTGLNELLKNGYLEGCGVINGRKLYVLVDKEVYEEEKKRDKKYDRLINEAYLEGYRAGVESGKFEATLSKYTKEQIREIFGLN